MLPYLHCPLSLSERKVRPMRSRELVYFISLFSLLALPATLRAQFQDATPQERQMTADPKAPGAAAVYLNVTEIADNNLGFHSLYVRAKILAEKGESLATVEMPYERDWEGYVYEVAAIQGRTIHPDGSVVPLKGKPADLLVSKVGTDKIARKVFTLPDVTVGSIIEYYYQLRYRDVWDYPPVWHIQRDYFIHKAHYMFNTNTDYNVGLWTVLPTGIKVTPDALNRYSLDIEDIPAAPNEDWMPPIQSSLYRVQFYIRESNDPEVYWKTVGAKWSKLVDEFANPSRKMRNSLINVVTASDTDLDKAKKIYKFVQDLDNTDFSREKSKAERKDLKLKNVKHAEDVLTDKSGSSTEIALLYLSMLRAAGLNAYAMTVVDRDRGLFTSGYMYFDQLDDTIILLNIGGKEIVLDPGEKMCPFQTVSWKHSLATGIRQSANGTVISTSPSQPYSANTIQRIAELTLDPTGVIDGNVRILMTGQEALYWRQKALENDEAEVKKQFEQWVTDMVPDGAHVQIDHFIALANPEDTLAAVVKVQAATAAATSKRILVPGFFFETRGSHPFVAQDKRLTPVDMHYAEVVSDDVTYQLPTGLNVESAPQAAKIPWEGHAVMLIKSKTDPTEVNITRTFARTFTFAKTDDYTALHDFYQKVAAADQQQLVLTRTPAAAAASGAN
jgi:transglutaminase-like putative cysteine protease